MLDSTRCIMIVAAVLYLGLEFAARADEPAKVLNHDQTLRWIHEHKAWRLARKTRPMYARPVRKDEVGKEFQTADRATEKAREGYWLCVGIAGEPWFQHPDKIAAKYTRGAEESRKFAFDDAARPYVTFTPKGEVRNWVAEIKDPAIEGFTITPNYNKNGPPLYSPAGGYVVRDAVPDPYKANPDDVWLVQKAIFESTYELVR